MKTGTVVLIAILLFVAACTSNEPTSTPAATPRPIATATITADPAPAAIPRPIATATITAEPAPAVAPRPIATAAPGPTPGPAVSITGFSDDGIPTLLDRRLTKPAPKLTQHPAFRSDFRKEIRISEEIRLVTGGSRAESRKSPVEVWTYDAGADTVDEWLTERGIFFDCSFPFGSENGTTVFHLAVPILLLEELADVEGVFQVEKPPPFPGLPYHPRPGTPVPTVRNGADLFVGDGYCSACHTRGRVDKGGIVGPDLTNLAAVAGTRRPGLSAGEYVVESIERPDAYIHEGCTTRAGFPCPPGIMSHVLDLIHLSDRDVDSLAMYLLTP